ncbi:MAG: lipocalin family protein [Ferrimonas sp.]
MTRYLLFCCFFLSGCTGLPNGVQPVTDFSLERYLGQWYEIARTDNKFERGLNQVTATYQRQGDGGVRVLNRGFNTNEQRWKQANGKAYFVSNQDTGHLKVSFWGPFYSSYVIFELDQDYQYAFVSGYNQDYLWLLARTPDISEEIKQRFIQQAQQLGIESNQLIWPMQ